MLGEREELRRAYESLEILLVGRVSRVYLGDDLILSRLGDVVRGYLKLLPELGGVGSKLGSGLIRMTGDKKHRRRVLPFERFFHVLCGNDALVIIDEDYIDGPPQNHQVVDGPRAYRQDDDDQQSVAERQFTFQASHASSLTAPV